MTGLRVVKGHGTQNDFVVLPDLDGRLGLTADLARALCDRRSGVGADGVLRVVRSENDPDGQRWADGAPFFMDYRNADGSIAETCGNGLRVFARYLQRERLIDEHIVIATRGGACRAVVRADGQISVDMGRPERLNVPVRVRGAQARAVRMPNPHVVVAVAHDAALAELDLTRAPEVTPELPAGQNVEFVVQNGQRHLHLRVFERGVGETRSCGTGICAAVAVFGAPDGTTWQVSVPGGRTEVVWSPNGQITLTGPAVLVADLTVSADWLAEQAPAR